MTRLPVGLLFGAVAFMLGCSNAPPEETTPVTVQEMRDRIGDSEKKSFEQNRKLTKSVEQVEAELAAIDQWRRDLTEGSQSKLSSLDARLQRIESQLKQLHEKIDLLPTPTKLQMKIPADIEGTLEEALAELSGITTLAMRIEAGDLNEARIPKIRRVELPAGQTAEALLRRALAEVNPEGTRALDDPKQVLVYVVHPLPDGRHDEIVITTRKHAYERGKLPTVFVKAE